MKEKKIYKNIFFLLHFAFFLFSDRADDDNYDSDDSVTFERLKGYWKTKWGKVSFDPLIGTFSILFFFLFSNRKESEEGKAKGKA